MNMPPPNHWKNDDDFRMSIVPRWLDQFWDYESNRTYASLMRMVANNRLPRLSIFDGPMGSGKTLAAYGLACSASCPKYDPVSHAPCGTCDVCEHVLLSKDPWFRGALLEIDGAHRDKNGNQTASYFINEARSKSESHRTSMVNDPSRKCIVFIDEAHKLTVPVRESLLKQVEQWVGAHIILATTRLDLLAINGMTGEGNPLLSRGDIFRFEYPTESQCLGGLVKAATTVNIILDADVARWIVVRHACCPRDCLGELYRLSNHGSHITRKAVIDEYGLEAWENPHG